MMGGGMAQTKGKNIMKRKDLKKALKKNSTMRSIADTRVQSVLMSSNTDGFTYTKRNPFKSGDKVLVKILCYPQYRENYAMPNEQEVIGLVESTTDCAVKIRGRWYHINQVEKHFPNILGYEK